MTKYKNQTNARCNQHSKNKHSKQESLQYGKNVLIDSESETIQLLSCLQTSHSFFSLKCINMYVIASGVGKTHKILYKE